MQHKLLSAILIDAISIAPKLGRRCREQLGGATFNALVEALIHTCNLTQPYVNLLQVELQKLGRKEG